MKTLHQIPVAGKRVLTRVDFNVPLNSDGSIADDMRILAHLDTIRHLIAEGAKVVLISHTSDESISLKMASEHLSQVLGKTVTFCETCVGSKAESAVHALQDGDVLLLENLRHHKGEKSNDPVFAAELAKLGDVYVNDAFAVAHREHASVAAITDMFDVRAAGMLMAMEIATLTKATKEAERPFSVIVGGAKISTKLGLLKEIINDVDHLFIGGAMANTFLMSEGHNMGASLIETGMLSQAKEILDIARDKGCKVHLPRDVVAAPSISDNGHDHICMVDQVPENQMALDIGPMTTQEWFRALDGSKTILWNGPLGAFEIERFRTGTTAIAHELASMNSSFRVVGGGDTIAALTEAGVTDRFDLVSTGGGAMLRFLEGEPLPGVEALRDSMHD